MSTEPAPQPLRRRRRGIVRRAAILQATLRVLGREGSAAITHRSVAEEAGVPIASTPYYFSSKDDLLKEALYLHVEQEAQRVAQATHTIRDTPTVDDSRIGSPTSSTMGSTRAASPSSPSTSFFCKPPDSQTSRPCHGPSTKQVHQFSSFNH